MSRIRLKKTDDLFVAERQGDRMNHISNLTATLPVRSRDRFKLLAVLLVLFAAPSLVFASGTQSFEDWRAELRSEAVAKGITESVFDTAFTGVAPIERVIELDRRQPEFTMTLDTYLSKVVSATRVKKPARNWPNTKSFWQTYLSSLASNHVSLWLCGG